MVVIRSKVCQVEGVTSATQGRSVFVVVDARRVVAARSQRSIEQGSGASFVSCEGSLVTFHVSVQSRVGEDPPCLDLFVPVSGVRIRPAMSSKRIENGRR